MSVRSGILTLAALAPVLGGCGIARHVLPGGARYDSGGAGVSECESCLLPPEAELSCVAFAVEGSTVSPPVFLEDVETVEDGQPEELPLTAPGTEEAEEPDRSILEPPSSTQAVGYDLPAPALVETEEEFRQSLALQAASIASSTRRPSRDETVGALREPIERDPPPTESQEVELPIVPPAQRLAERDEPVRADYVNAPPAKVVRHIHLPRRRIGDGVLMRPGLIAGLHGRIAAHREPPEPVPFVVYERVAPRFLPVPTRPAFEPATATYAAYASPPAAPGIIIRPPLSPPPPSASSPAPGATDSSTASPAEETLPRPLPSMDVLPLPQPEANLPPAPRIDDF